MTAVHYNDAPSVRSFIGHVLSLPRPEGWNVEIALADNSGSWPEDGSLHDGARVFSTGSNAGYLGGCAFAFAKWKSEHGVVPDWTGVVNTDIVLAHDFFTKLTESWWPDDTGAIAPDVRLQSGVRQNPHMRVRPHRARMALYAAVYRSSWLSAAYLGLFRMKATIKRTRVARDVAHSLEPPPLRIYAPHGSAMFLARRFFQRGGTLDYRGFMYGEEIHVAEHCRRLGLAVYWLPGLGVTHQAHTSTRGVAQARRRRWLQESARIAWEDYFCRR